MGDDQSKAGKSKSSLLLAEDGSSDYQIVVSQESPASERHGAEELQRFLEEICGARIPIVTDGEALGTHEIILGENAHLDLAGITVDTAGLGEEGFIIRTEPPHLVIIGGRRRGTMYGVYAFLEEHLGCRWFTSTVSHIPSSPRLEISHIDERQVPILEYRDVFFKDSRDVDWAARNRVNGTWDLPEEYGGRVAFYPFGHSFWALIPPDEYFEAHPEWFSLVDGERTLVGRYQRTQLCLTNEEMTQQAIRNVKGWIRDHPEAKIISVSQNDGPGGWCECDSCRALEEREGGAHSAPVINFVNRVAEAIAKDHPDVLIDTFAYSYSHAAPRSLKPLPNVVIRLTGGGCCSHMIRDEKCIHQAGMRQALNDWFRLTKRIYVWDYIVNFRQYLMPVPNLHILGPNIRYLISRGVRGLFMQGSGDVLSSDMAPLKAYFVAKLMWNPEYDESKAVGEFLEAYYGEASGPIGEYLELLKTQVQGKDYHSLHVRPFEPSIGAPFLTPEVMVKAAELFDEAERLVARDSERLVRVRAARLSLDYVKLSMAARIVATVDSAQAQLPIGDWYRNSIEGFFDAAKSAGYTHWRESGRPNSSMEDLRKILEEAARRAS